MAKYIDLTALGIGRCNPEVFRSRDYAAGWNGVISLLEKAPAADVVPVRHGEWVGPVYDIWRCTACGAEIDSEDPPTYRYCPNCGAKMDGGDDNGT